MDIVTRNFFRLLRAGAFGKQDNIEPMSAYKWQKVLQLSILHGVETEAYQGLEVVSNQFAVQLVSADVRKKWVECIDLQTSAHLPLHTTASSLHKRLSNHLITLAKECDTMSVEYQLLEKSIYLANALLTDDHWVKRMIDFGEIIREGAMAKADQALLKKWIRILGLKRMAMLEGMLLIELAGFLPEELPSGYLFDSQKSPLLSSRLHSLVESIASSVPEGQQQLKFSQEGNDIFVHTSNTNALVSNTRRSARFLPYYPVESVAQLFSSLASSLTNIEE